MRTKQKTRNRRVARRLKDGTITLRGRKIRKEPVYELRDEDIIDEVAYSMLEDEEVSNEAVYWY